MFRTIATAFLYLYMFYKKVQIPLVVPLCFIIGYLHHCYGKEINSMLFNKMAILHGTDLLFENFSIFFLSILALVYLLFKHDLERYSQYFAYIAGFILCVYAFIELSVVNHYFV